MTTTTELNQDLLKLVLSSKLFDYFEITDLKVEYQLEHLLKSCQHVSLDGTERPIVRLKDAERQKTHYRGKKKTHEVKNNVLTLLDRRIVWLSKTYQGSVHDKKICDLQPLLFPKGITLWQDTGFQGYTPEGVIVYLPKQKT